MTIDRFEAQLADALTDLQRIDRFRALAPRQGLDLSSNDYLALAEHPYVRDAMRQALDDGIPLGATGSRLLRGNTSYHEDLEHRLAAFRGTEAAVIFNSGYVANVGLFATLAGPQDTIFSDALIHASMIDGIRTSKAQKVIFPHNDLNALESALAAHQGGGRRFIAVESLYSMDGDKAPLSELAALAERFDALLIVDEAHATGVFGPNGSGLCRQAGIQPLATVHTGGKAWGGYGAFIACSDTVKQFLVNRCRHLIFTTAPPPLLTVQWHAVLDVIEREPQRAEHALAMAQQFREAVRDYADTGASESQIVPVICGSDTRALEAAAQLQAEGFDIRAIRPPTVPKGSARLRLAFNAGLKKADVTRLAESCCRIFAKN
ncbi:MAG: 8-amino-7-oxononanoate synthase [Acidobacteriota bacterium]|nr:8-amino-7-oxononanoate synthase [Acidobacteriota bacterium]